MKPQRIIVKTPVTNCQSVAFALVGMLPEGFSFVTSSYVQACGLAATFGSGISIRTVGWEKQDVHTASTLHSLLAYCGVLPRTAAVLHIMATV